MNEQRNLWIAIAVSVVILVGFQFLFPHKPDPQVREAQVREQLDVNSTAPKPSTSTAAPSAPGGSTAAPVANRDDALASSPRIAIDTPRVKGSIRLVGGLIDDIQLQDYRETEDPQSPLIHVLNPAGSDDAYFGEFGWVAADGSKVALPGNDTRWQADGEKLSADKPVTLSWDNGEGLVFKRTISIDENYMFSVKQSVTNNSGQDVSLYPYGLISRRGLPHTSGYYILHEGPIGVVDGSLKEISYKDLMEEDGTVSEKSTGGWVGITDKYWLVALAPANDESLTARFSHHNANNTDKFQADYLGSQRTIANGETASSESHMFAGAKEYNLLDAYADQYNIKLFDRAIDFGWFWFLTIPFFQILQWINHVIGNFGLSILAFTVLVKAVMFPLANKSYKSMSGMKKLQPKMTQIREQFADDRQRQQQEIMALYKREKINPASGCLPIVVQIPVFFALYKVLFVNIEMRHAPFFGWIQDLSAPDPTTLFNLFGLIDWTPPHMLMIGVWPLIMGITMFLQQKLNPAPADPTQAKIMMFLPIIFTFMLAKFPAGLVIYWAWNNTLSIIQQRYIMYRMGV
ncbi:membrane protein insertase YidC [Thalassospira marina]|uniref:Membrane protein insertase YidC n=1 Tax=Thalassospira marina TaxID=2048283 RepID=A0A2N3KZ02_9PROT|nr:membrane protein insertase YidC [Thalassospira marina]AUG51830.1 membrane protein insertase YidC [Thalassospira marina]PKR55758.1 membrane protein insertase YidC [Thalassospira marina]